MGDKGQLHGATDKDQREREAAESHLQYSPYILLPPCRRAVDQDSQVPISICFLLSSPLLISTLPFSNLKKYIRSSALWADILTP